jgi:hypothetical protein
VVAAGAIKMFVARFVLRSSVFHLRRESADGADAAAY